jgi:hypothetical protein
MAKKHGGDNPSGRPDECTDQRSIRITYLQKAQKVCWLAVGGVTIKMRQDAASTLGDK